MALAGLVGLVLSIIATQASALERGAVWLGVSGCEADIHFSLRLSAPEGDVTGQIVGDLDEQTVIGRFADGRLELEPGVWLARRAPRNAVPKGMTGTYLVDQGLLVGELTGGMECPSFVAKRIEVPDRVSNPDGLLHRLAPRVRARDVYSKADCQRYVEWRISGERGKSPRGGNFDTAVGNHSRMQRVLGKDIFDWTEDDARAIRGIGQACKTILRNASDPKSIQLASDVAARGGGYFPNPLDKPPFGRPWQSLFLFLHSDVIAELQVAARLAEEGLLAQSPVALETAAEEDRWVGLMDCKRGDRYLRISFPVAADGGMVEVEFGPSLETIHPRGALSARGTFDAEGFRLDPDAWIYRPRAIGFDSAPFTLEGRQVGDDKVEGRIEGIAECDRFRAYRAAAPRADINPDGLLMKVVGLRSAHLDEADCHRYIEWLADGEIVRYGTYGLNSLTLDPDRIWELFGKEPVQWGSEDHQHFLSIASVCRNMFRDTANVELAQKLRSIVSLDVAPLSRPRNNRDVFDWMRWELVPIVNREALETAADDLASAEGMSHKLASFDRIDGLSTEARDIRGRLRFLTATQREAHLADLKGARRKLGLAIVADAVAAFPDAPQTLAALLEMEDRTEFLTAALRRKSAKEAADVLKSAFRNEARTRALVLWPDFLDRADAVLLANADAGYLAFPELMALRREVAILSRYADPRSSEALAPRYASYRSRDRDLAFAMVRRSESGLVRWIEAMEPSATANARLSAVVVDTFETERVPDEFDRLRSAIREKRAAYNPLRLFRPDIVLALGRGHWSEVSYRGLENLAYLTTAMEELFEACPGIVPQRGEPAFGDITSFVMSASTDAMERLVRGEATRSEAERGVFIFLNGLFNQPGCLVDMFGNVTNTCTTVEEHQAGFELAMHSSDAVFDINQLLHSGCADPTLTGFVDGYAEFVALRPFTRSTPQMRLPAIEDFLER